MMIFEFLTLDDSTIEFISKLNLSHIDKLFLRVCIIDDIYLRISKVHLLKLKQLDQSKIILLTIEYAECATKCKKYIKIKEWFVLRRLRRNRNYIFKNYNFIYADCLKKIIRQTVIDKVNIVLLWHNPYSGINDRIRAQDSEIFCDIIVNERTPSHARTIKSWYGTIWLNCNHFYNDFKFIRLNEEKVYLTSLNFGLRK